MTEPPLMPIPQKPRPSRWAMRLGMLAVVFLTAGGVVIIADRVRLRETLAATSPDGVHRVIVREPRRFIDRNFRVFLVDQRTGLERQVFKSYDQSPLITRERIVWSDDSSKFALVGDRYYVLPGAALPGGEIAFLLYDIDADRLWCNTDVNRGLTPITAAQAVSAIGKPLE